MTLGVLAFTRVRLAGKPKPRSAFGLATAKTYLRQIPESTWDKRSDCSALGLRPARVGNHRRLRWLDFRYRQHL
jgi:hypothetical protein